MPAKGAKKRKERKVLSNYLSALCAPSRPLQATQSKTIPPALVRVPTHQQIKTTPPWCVSSRTSKLKHLRPRACTHAPATFKSLPTNPLKRKNSSHSAHNT